MTQDRLGLGLWRGTAAVAGAWLKSKTAERAGDQAANRYLVDALASLGAGLPGKAAQIFAAQGDLGVPDHSASALPLAEVKALIARQAPALYQRVVALEEPAVAASLGQVHAARLDDGRRLAVKVQYPGVAARIESQLALLLKSAGIAKWFAGAAVAPVDHAGYLAYGREKLREELDYAGEALRQQRFAAGLGHLRGLAIPAAHSALSTPLVLAQDWIETRPLAAAASLPLATRQALVATLVEATLHQVFVLGEMHADLHQGNVALTTEANPRLVFFDFGATLAIPRPAAEALASMLKMLRRGATPDAEAATASFATLGFDQAVLGRMAEKLPELWRVFLAPFSAPGAFDPKDWDFGVASQAVLGAQRMSFRMAGPPWFLLLMRAFAGVASGWRALAAPFDAKPLVDALVQAPAPGEHWRAAPAGRPASQARLLCVSIVRDREEVVAVQLPGAAIANLDDVVPDNAKDTLRRLGHDLTAIRQRAAASGLRPQLLFEADLGDRTIKVWLE